MKKNTKKRFRDIRNAVVMMCVMVAMMSTASYAWFTMTDSPTVTGMNMTATATSGLKISLDDSTYEDAVKVVEDDTTAKTLKPVTPLTPANVSMYTETEVNDYIKFQEAVYSGKTATGLADVPGTKIKTYVAKYTVYLKATDTSATGKFGIGIICGDKNQTGDMVLDANKIPEVAGSVVRTKTSPTGKNLSEYAVRVGLLPEDSTELIIWEPNDDEVSTNGTTAAAQTGAANIAKASEGIKVSSSADGEINTGKGNPSNTSIKLFEMDKSARKKVDIFIWLQGSDEHCVDQIQKDDLEAQIQFTVVEDVTN